jgi:hypothetical protein
MCRPHPPGPQGAGLPIQERISAVAFLHGSRQCSTCALPLVLEGEQFWTDAHRWIGAYSNLGVTNGRGELWQDLRHEAPTLVVNLACLYHHFHGRSNDALDGSGINVRSNRVCLNCRRIYVYRSCHSQICTKPKNARRWIGAYF